jgi:ABC-type nickel/cobalt efflux system permease component RcnA
VTITHTAGVFALGVGTLLASEYFVPDKMFPILSLISGAIVVAIGGSLLLRRLRSLKRSRAHHHGVGEHSHDFAHYHDEDHEQDPTQPHSHGGRIHSHLPPGADGGPITWRSLLALGISGGMLPCPSALVVLLAAIALHRVGYGLLLVVAFSAGLAGALTTVGLAFVYGSRFVKSTGKFDRLTNIVPVVSAVVVTCAGLAICYSALDQAGINVATIALNTGRAFRGLGTNEASLQSLGSFGMLGLGLVFGLKHATEIDHIVAVSAIVSEERKLSRAALVGGLWGAGHTFSLVVVGVIVLVLRISIPESLARWLEFGVALMIIGLGITALFRRLRFSPSIHLHEHAHSIGTHRHIHFHELDQGGVDHSHRIKRIGLKPAIVGAMHGLAGSAALTLLVLSQISSLTLGLLYLLVFGVGSIVGMFVMSGLMGLPFVFSSQRLGRFHYGLQVIAGSLSIAFGIWYAYVTGVMTGLLRLTS